MPKSKLLTTIEYKKFTDLQDIISLIENGATDSDNPVLACFFDSYRYYDLSKEMQNKYYQVTHDLIHKAKAQVNLVDGNDYSPLYKAIEFSQVPISIIELLIENGATDSDNPILVRFFERYRYYELSKEMQDKYYQLTYNLIHKAKAQVNLVDGNDCSPLYKAIEFSQVPISIIELLIENGATDSDNPILVCFFERYRYYKLSKEMQDKYYQLTYNLIDKAKANVDKQDCHNRYPIEIAIHVSKIPVDVTELLVSKISKVYDGLLSDVCNHTHYSKKSDLAQEERILNILATKIEKISWSEVSPLMFCQTTVIETYLKKTDPSQKCAIPPFRYSIYATYIDYDIEDQLAKEQLLDSCNTYDKNNSLVVDKRILLVKDNNGYRVFYRDLNHTFCDKEIIDITILNKLKELRFEKNKFLHISKLTPDYKELLNFIFDNIIDHKLNPMSYLIDLKLFNIIFLAIKLDWLEIEQSLLEKLYFNFINNIYSYFDNNTHQIIPFLEILDHYNKDYLSISSDLKEPGIYFYQDINALLINLEAEKMKNFLALGMQPMLTLLYAACEAGVLDLATILNEHFGRKFRLIEQPEQGTIKILPIYGPESSGIYQGVIQPVSTIQSCWRYRRYTKQSCFGFQEHFKPPEIKLKDPDCLSTKKLLVKHYSPNIKEILLNSGVIRSRANLELSGTAYYRGISDVTDDTFGDKQMISFAIYNTEAANQANHGCITIELASHIIGLFKLIDFQASVPSPYEDSKIKISFSPEVSNDGRFLLCNIEDIIEKKSADIKFSLSEITYFGKISAIQNFALNFIDKIIAKLNSNEQYELATKLKTLATLQWRNEFMAKICEYSEIAILQSFSLTLDNLSSISLTPDTKEISIDKLKQIVTTGEIRELKDFLNLSENKFLLNIEFIIHGIYLKSFSNLPHGAEIRNYLIQDLNYTPQHKDNNMMLSDKIIEVALYYANRNYLSQKYTDNAISNNQSDEFEHKGEMIYRPNHGLTHVVRTMIYMEHAIEYFSKFAKDKNFQDFCANIQYTDKLLINLSLIFLVSGRQSEVDFRYAPQKCTEYRENSAKYFVEYCRNNLKSILPKEINIDIYQRCILDLCKRWGEWETYGKEIGHEYKYLQVLIDFAHQLDLPRCKSPEDYAEYLSKYDDLIDKSHVQAQEKSAITELAKNLVAKTNKSGELELNVETCINTMSKLHQEHVDRQRAADNSCKYRCTM